MLLFRLLESGLLMMLPLRSSRSVSFLSSVLGDVLSPIEIFQMAPDLVKSIAGESQEKQNQREDLVRQLEVLTTGAKTCQSFISMEYHGECIRS